ncbi:MAG: thioredoxin [Planctomycetota bacterium]|jgi:thioredoxin 1|nr:thioredoxin [Planctomycetota bacterium]
MPDDMIELADDTFASGVADGVTVVEFYGAWCPPCRQLEPILEAVAADYRGRAKVARINVDEHASSAIDNLVTDIPTLVFFKDGEEKGRKFGVQSSAALAAELEKLLA